MTVRKILEAIRGLPRPDRLRLVEDHPVDREDRIDQLISRLNADRV